MNQKISIIIGTNRPNSRSKLIAEYYSKILKNKGIINEVILLSNFTKPLNIEEIYELPAIDNPFEKKLLAIEKMIIVVPEYNGSYPGVLKTLIDSLKSNAAFNEKKVALVGLSSGVLGNAVGLGHLSDVLSYLGAHILGLRIKLGQIDKYMADDRVQNPVYEKFISQQIESFIKF